MKNAAALSMFALPLSMLLGVERAEAVGTITDLGPISPYTNSTSLGVSGNGALAVGLMGGTVPAAATMWSAGVPMSLGTLAGDTTSSALGISADGSTVVGNSTRSNAGHAFYWTAGDGMLSVGFLPGHDFATATGVSADGSVIVGTSGFNLSLGSNRAYRWVNGVMENLGTFPPGSSVANAVSADGTTVVGGSNTMAFRWTAATGMVNIAAGQTTGSTNAYAVNADGTVVAGGNGHMVRWSVTDGWQDLGTLPTGNNAVGYGITADGNTIVGAGNGFQGQRALLWTAATGIVDLNTYLPLHGVDTTGWQLTYARAISADGRSISGEGVHNGLNRGWLVTGLGTGTTPGCAADFNGSGSLTVQDIFDFLAAYFAGCP